MAKTINGTITAVSEKNKSVLLDAVWYSAVGKAQEYIKKNLKGALVELQMKNNSDFDYIRVKRECKMDTRVNRIERQCFMKISATILSSEKGNKTPQAIIEYAQELEDEFNRWCSG